LAELQQEFHLDEKDFLEVQLKEPILRLLNLLAQSQFVEPQFVEPQFIEPQFVEFYNIELLQHRTPVRRTTFLSNYYFSGPDLLQAYF
jgi:hypothetical protein